MSEPSTNSSEPPRETDGLEQVCVGVLRSEFGRRESRALSNAIIQLAAEQAALSHTAAAPRPDWRQRIRDWFIALPPRSNVAIAAALVLVIGLASWSVWSFERSNRAASPGPICTFSDSLDAHWAKNSPHPKMGEGLSAGPMRLESGVVEVTFATHAAVAIEGPAQFTLTGVNSMELESGKISTYVPRSAAGFTVKTPAATVVDLGTRFGAIVSSERTSEVDVFQGSVALTAKAGAENRAGKWRLTQNMAVIADEHGVVTGTALPEIAFPQPNLEVLARPQNCGFDVSARAALGGIPTDFGYWSGPAYSLIGAAQGVEPYNGKGMLQFLGDPASRSGVSQVWQLIDLHSLKKLLASGQVKAEFSTYFNRIHDANSGDKFGITLAAFHGTAADAKSLWAQRQSSALALADKELVADDDPATWEKIDVTAQLPPQTDFVIIELRAVASGETTGKISLLPGHFADLVELKLRSPMRASSIATSR